MANLKEIRTRISSITSTMQITSAMKMVSAAKLKRAQDHITQLRPYSEKLSQILENISSGLSGNDSIFTKQGNGNNVLILAISSNRGLCGPFNANIIKQTKILIEETYKDKSITLLTAGKKVTEAFKHTEYALHGTTLPRNLDYIFDDLTFENVAKITENLMEVYSHKQFDKVVIVYNQFKNAAVQNVMVEQLLPVVVEKKQKAMHSDYIFEPNQEEIVKDLIPKALKIQMFKSFLDSNASEHGARMTAMHKATDNAGELLGDLQLTYNKARQAAITNEILEIVGGAEALKG